MNIHTICDDFFFSGQGAIVIKINILSFEIKLINLDSYIIHYGQKKNSLIFPFDNSQLFFFTLSPFYSLYTRMYHIDYALVVKKERGERKGASNQTEYKIY